MGAIDWEHLNEELTQVCKKTSPLLSCFFFILQSQAYFLFFFLFPLSFPLSFLFSFSFSFSLLFFSFYEKKGQLKWLEEGQEGTLTVLPLNDGLKIRAKSNDEIVLFSQHFRFNKICPLVVSWGGGGGKKKKKLKIGKIFSGEGRWWWYFCIALISPQTPNNNHNHNHNQQTLEQPSQGILMALENGKTFAFLDRNKSRTIVTLWRIYVGLFCLGNIYIILCTRSKNTFLGRNESTLCD